MSKELYVTLEEKGLLKYGSFIPAELVRKAIGITLPMIATKSVYDDLALQELNAIGYVKNLLLDQGKYIKRTGQDYRILLVSENKNQIKSYEKAADKKLNKAIRLHKSSPHREKHHDNTEARLHMKKASVRRFSAFADMAN